MVSLQFKIKTICLLRLLVIFVITKSICFSFHGKTRYDINLVAARQHIECVSTYRVCKTYRKSHTRFISTKKRQISLSKSVFFLVHLQGHSCFAPCQLDDPSLWLRYPSSHHSPKNSSPNCFLYGSCPLRLRVPSV